LKTTLVITTYNWPEALNLVLKSILAQTIMPFEVIVADDGSKPETKEIIDHFKDKLSVPLRHIWHEDKGFRRSAILNKSIALAKGEYIIQIDGDCIVHKNFVKDHNTSAEKNTYLYGSRVNIQKDFLPTLYSNEVTTFSYFAKGIKKRTRNLHIPILANLYKRKDGLSKKIRGCNLSYWKSDFIKINGYNEAMTGWGKEDSELVIRLLNNNIQGKRLRYKAIIYHIWHNVSSKERLNINQEIQEHTIQNKLKKCEKGVDMYL